MDNASKLEQELERKNISHAYLVISGERAEIETAIDQLLVRRGCQPEDLIVLDKEIDDSAKLSKKELAKSDSGEIKADEVREFIRQLNLSSYGGGRIGVIWSAERLNRVSANILLKTLEEPPRNVTIILLSSTENILPTIKSRCRIVRTTRQSQQTGESRYDFDSLIRGNLVGSFKKIEELVKSDEVDQFLGQLLVHFELKLKTGRDPKDEIALRQILVAERKIKGNANKRLILENLIMDMKK